MVSSSMAYVAGIRTKLGLGKLRCVHFGLSRGMNREIELNILYNKGNLD